MREFMILIGEIFVISCVQSLTEIFIDPGDHPYQAKILSVACYAGCLYLLIQYVFDNILSQLSSVMNFTF